MILLSLITITARLRKPNNNSWNALANLATSATLKATKIITIIITVARIDQCGVPNFPIVANRSFSSLSLAIAIGYREADIIPALPVEAKAATAAITTRIRPTDSGNHVSITSPAEATGVRSSRNSLGSSTETIINTPTTYTKTAVIIAKNIPSGRLRSGFLTSSAILATFVKPA